MARSTAISRRDNTPSTLSDICSVVATNRELKHPSPHATVPTKMVPSPSLQAAEAVNAASTEGHNEERRNIEDLPEWDAQSSSQPFIDYKRLSIEVATRSTPDLQETLETTIQTSLLKLKSDIHTHAGRLTELENRVSYLEDENATLGTKVITMATDLTHMGEKMEELKNRSQCNNLCKVGLPESVLQKDLQHLCEVDLPKTLGLTHAC